MNSITKKNNYTINYQALRYNYTVLQFHRWEQQNWRKIKFIGKLRIPPVKFFYTNVLKYWTDEVAHIGCSDSHSSQELSKLFKTKPKKKKNVRKLYFLTNNMRETFLIIEVFVIYVIGFPVPLITNIQTQCQCFFLFW